MIKILDRLRYRREATSEPNLIKQRIAGHRWCWNLCLFGEHTRDELTALVQAQRRGVQCPVKLAYNDGAVEAIKNALDAGILR